MKTSKEIFVNPQNIEICQNCKIGFSRFTTCLRSKDGKLKEYKTSLELTPCDFVALVLDPKDHVQLESGSYLDLIRNCFHQCLTLFGNGVSEHAPETILSYLISQKDIGYPV